MQIHNILRIKVFNVGNLGLPCSHALDLIRCMNLSLGLSRSNIVEDNGFKNHYKIKIQRKSAHTQIWMFSDQFLTMKNMTKKIGESLLILLPTCVSHTIPVNMACTHHVRFQCMRLMCIPCDSHACDLCDSNALLIHLRSSTQ